MVVMGLASFSSDLTMPISWDACVVIGGPYTATIAAAMNTLGNLAGFVAPVIGGIILERSDNNWNMLIYTMFGAAMISALSWLVLHPERAARNQQAGLQEANAVSDSLSL